MTGVAGDESAGMEGTESVFDRLRNRREEMAEDRTLDIDIPGYGGQLVGRFGALGLKAMADVRRRLGIKSVQSLDLEQEALVGASVLAAACREMFARDEDGNLVPLVDNGPPVRFDERLTAGLGLPESHSAEAVMAVMAVEVDVTPLQGLISTYNEWRSVVTEEDDEKLMGE